MNYVESRLWFWLQGEISDIHKHSPVASLHKRLAYELKFVGLQAETSSVQSCIPIWHEQLGRLAKLFLEGEG